MNNSTTLVVVPWHNPEQIARFLKAWQVQADDPRFVFQQDKTRAGCAVTKNAGIDEALRRGAETVIILDDDCFPGSDFDKTEMVEGLIATHEAMLRSVSIERYKTLTDPPSRGTPYHYENRCQYLPVAASMGFWEDVGDYCAVRQLSYREDPEEGAAVDRIPPMTFNTDPVVFNQYFPLSGMNLAFRPREWLPWCRFIDVPRFDDIWMGWLWQKEAYRRGYCFNLDGPIVRHSRQSNVWKNLQLEAVHLERNETLWRDIAQAPADADYETLLELLPTHHATRTTDHAEQVANT